FLSYCLITVIFFFFLLYFFFFFFFFFQAEDGIRDFHVTGVQTCALPISFFGPGESSRRNHLEFVAGHVAGLHLHVHGARGAIRKLFLSVHHHADAATERALRAFLALDYRSRA